MFSPCQDAQHGLCMENTSVYPEGVTAGSQQSLPRKEMATSNVWEMASQSPASSPFKAKETSRLKKEPGKNVTEATQNLPRHAME